MKAGEEPRLDYDEIAAHIADHRVVGFGESTHGTHEFFQTKVEVFKRLVTNHGFDTLFLESLDEHCAAIDEAVREGGAVAPLVDRLFYVYRTQEVLGLFRWLQQNTQAFPVSIIGLDQRIDIVADFDDYSQAAFNRRDKRMGRQVIRYAQERHDMKGFIWAHDIHIAAAADQADGVSAGVRTMGSHLRKKFGDEYFSVSQLFGRGGFNAVSIPWDGPYSYSQLEVHQDAGPPAGFVEMPLAAAHTAPFFSDVNGLQDVIEPRRAYLQRSLGWGLKKAELHTAGNVFRSVFARTYDAVTFFPTARQSDLLADHSSL